MKAWKITFYSLSIIPLVFALSMLTLYIRLWSHVGYAPGFGGKYPYYSEISPDQLQNDVLVLSLVGSGLALFLTAPLILMYLFVNRKNIIWHPVVVCISSFAVGFLVAQSDLLNWYLD